MLRGVTINILIMFVPFQFLKNRSKEQNESESRWQGYETLIPFAVTKDLCGMSPDKACQRLCFPLLFRLLISVFLLYQLVTYLQLSEQIPQPPHKHSAPWPGQRCPASEPPVQRYGVLQYHTIMLLLVKGTLRDVGCFTWLFFCLIYYDNVWGKSHHNYKTTEIWLLIC